MKRECSGVGVTLFLVAVVVAFVFAGKGVYEMKSPSNGVQQQVKYGPMHNAMVLETRVSVIANVSMQSYR